MPSPRARVEHAEQAAAPVEHRRAGVARARSPRRARGPGRSCGGSPGWSRQRDTDAPADRARQRPRAGRREAPRARPAGRRRRAARAGARSPGTASSARSSRRSSRRTRAGRPPTRDRAAGRSRACATVRTRPSPVATPVAISGTRPPVATVTRTTSGGAAGLRRSRPPGAAHAAMEPPSQRADSRAARHRPRHSRAGPTPHRGGPVVERTTSSGSCRRDRARASRPSARSSSSCSASRPISWRGWLIVVRRMWLSAATNVLSKPTTETSLGDAHAVLVEAVDQRRSRRGRWPRTRRSAAVAGAQQLLGRRGARLLGELAAHDPRAARRGPPPPSPSGSRRAAGAAPAPRPPSMCAMCSWPSSTRCSTARCAPSASSVIDAVDVRGRAGGGRSPRTAPSRRRRRSAAPASRGDTRISPSGRYSSSASSIACSRCWRRPPVMISSR